MQAASPYKHYPTKDDVLDDVASQIVTAVDTSAFDADEDWDVALAAWARSYRAAPVSHPNMVPFLAGGPGQRDVEPAHRGFGARRSGAGGLAYRGRRP